MFPQLKISVNSSVRCLDLSQQKNKLAVVDDTGLCQVFSNTNYELLFQVWQNWVMVRTGH